jgi:hypothetical protein
MAKNVIVKEIAIDSNTSNISLVLVTKFIYVLLIRAVGANLVPAAKLRRISEITTSVLATLL